MNAREEAQSVIHDLAAALPPPAGGTAKDMGDWMALIERANRSINRLARASAAPQEPVGKVNVRADGHITFKCSSPEQFDRLEAMHGEPVYAAPQPQAAPQEPVTLLRDAWATLHNLSVDMDKGPIRQQMQKRAQAIRVYLDSIENADGTYAAPQPQAAPQRTAR